VNSLATASQNRRGLVGAARAQGTRLREIQHGTAMPPARGAPAAVYPIAVNEEQRALAPVPINDRFPLVVGQSLSASYIASCFRLATTGYRLQYVDLLNELLEQDAHLFSVLQKRILSTANGRLEIVPAKLSKGHKDYDRAKKAAEYCQAEIDRIPDMAQTVAGLLWGIYYGLSASEIFWNRDSKNGWRIDRFGFIHNRRLAYPDYQSWDLYVWDQGQVLGWDSPWGISPTNSGTFGLRVASYPGKFLVHAPQLRGDYPTRDGIGRETSIWALFKRIGGRGASSYLERFAKSFFDVSYVTGKDGKPREANKEDIALAARIAATLGPGSGSLASHADSIQINAKSFDGGSSSKLTWQEWIQLCNAEMSKAVLGGTLGTDVGKGGGNRALGEVQERGEVDIEKYDATTFGQSFKRDVLTWLIRLNHPEWLDVVPSVLVHIDTDPDPKQLVDVAAALAKIGGPVDLDELAEQTGIALVPNDEKDEKGQPKPRRAYLPDVTAPASVDENLLSEEERQRQDDQADHDNAVEMQKAKQPKLLPGAPGAGQAAAGAAPTVKTTPGKNAPAKTTAKKTAKKASRAPRR
jgi:phage gp29-like protein